MKILGISSNYHDASAALVIDGKVAAAAAEERFTLQKHDPNFPVHSARYCLEQAGISAEDLDFIAYHEDPNSKFSRTLSSSFAHFPFSLPTFVKSMRDAITGGFWIKNRISTELDVDPRKIVYVPHHCSHAAQAFLLSPFDRAAIMTLDAAGEWMCSGLFTGDRNQSRIDPVAVVPFPHSLGLIYSCFTGFLGFKVNDGECSTMALAAFGEATYAEEVRAIIQAHEDGTYRIDGTYFDFSRDDSLPITPKFIEIFGSPRPYGSPVPFDSMSDGKGSADAESQRYADIAASVQLVLEETILRMARRLRETTGCNKLCVGGGVALNCVAMGKLMEAAIFDEVYVPPDPGDGGGALGAALFENAKRTGNMQGENGFLPYQGKAYSESEILSFLPHLRAASGVYVEVENDPAKTAVRTAELLAEGKIVGWMQDRFEVGPRALGNRSILCDPGNIQTARRLSQRVKKRASFRPYACSVAEFELDRVFGKGEWVAARNARWMQASSRVERGEVSKLRAAMHVDGTTRPHICRESQNPRLHRLLTEFAKHKGVAALLNTSFNESGMPIVASPAHALLMFLRTEMDVLVINGTLIRKGKC